MYAERRMRASSLESRHQDDSINSVSGDQQFIEVTTVICGAEVVI